MVKRALSANHIATVANIGPGRGTRVKLALVDPDSNFAVPRGAPGSRATSS